MQKMSEEAEKELALLSLDELKERCRDQRLKVSGSKSVLVQRLRAASLLDKKDESSDDDKEGEDSESEEEEVVAREGARAKKAVMQQPLSFKDVEDSLRTFSGDGKQSVRKWLEDFNETSEVCLWSEAQKIIYAKKLLRGSAKLFVTYEKCCGTWRKLERALISEFDKTLNSRQVHKELARTKKKGDESFHDYVYKMMEIASHSDIEIEAKIQYIIDGIQDEPVNKTVLYGAKDIKDLRKRLTQYEAMKNSVSQKSKTQAVKSAKETSKGTSSQDTKTSIRRCHNCGGKNHLGADCPFKDKGTKCFQCGEFGHIAAKCGKKEHPKQINECSVVQKQDGKIYKNVCIKGKRVKALIDTGSDLHLMRAEQYIRLSSPPLTGPEIVCKGLGANSVSTIGSFIANVEIDENKFEILIHVVSDIYLAHDLLLGSGLLKVADISLDERGARIFKRKYDVNAQAETLDVPEIFCINTQEFVDDDDARQADHVSVSDIKDVVIRDEVKQIIASYEPRNVKAVAVTLNLVLKDDIPVYERARRLAPIERDQVNDIIQKWLREGIIRPSTSEYASPVVIVKKRDGTIRLCIDYRKLNRKIIKDRYPLPVIEEQIDRLQGSTFFSTLDLKDGFFHVPVEEKSRKFTAFIVPDGQYEFLKTPFGLCNSPAVFQRFINAIFRDLSTKGIVLTYLDDLIIPSRTEREGLDNLRLVLETASDYELLINWNKCSFLQQRIEYLGYIIENECFRPSERKTLSVINFPKPTCVKQVQSFLGLTGYFRKFIPNYSIIARPLSNLLKDGVKFHFTKEQEDAFQQLKTKLCLKPVLQLYRVNAETELHTDASSQGFGAILLQRSSQDNLFHPVYYASWKTTEAESRYMSYELEVLAIVKALHKFRIYLIGNTFKIVTDCKAFSLTMNKKNLCVRVARWALLLEEFDYSIIHRPGKAMRHVDALSRNPSSILLISEDSESLINRLSRAQLDDEDLKPIFKIIENNIKSDYLFQNNILYKKHDDDLLLVVPRTMQHEIIKLTHDKGHFAVRKVEQLLKKEFWFARMREKIEKVVRNCVSCIIAERKGGKQEGWLHSLPKGTTPLDIYHLDHLGPIPSTKKNYTHLLVVVDSFTKFTWLYPTKSTTSEETIAKLVKQAVIFGNPRQVITDRGTAFTSRKFEQYCNEENIQHVLCTAGVPRGNGQVERINRIVIPILSKLAAPKYENWYKYVEQVQQYLNASPNRSTGFSPFELLVGKTMRLKNDLKIKELIDSEVIRSLQQERDEMRAQASEAINKVQKENSRTYNRKRKKSNIYKIGDLVAIKRTQFAPGSKLLAKYLGPYKIVSTKGADRYVVEKLGEHEGPSSTTSAADNIKRWISTNSSISDSEDMSDVDAEIDMSASTDGYQGLTSDQDGRVVGSISPMLTRTRAAALRAATA